MDTGAFETERPAPVNGISDSRYCCACQRGFGTTRSKAPRIARFLDLPIALQMRLRQRWLSRNANSVLSLLETYAALGFLDHVADRSAHLGVALDATTSDPISNLAASLDTSVNVYPPFAGISR